jgi:hypothetical protein
LAIIFITLKERAIRQSPLHNQTYFLTLHFENFLTAILIMPFKNNDLKDIYLPQSGPYGKIFSETIARLWRAVKRALIFQ